MQPSHDAAGRPVDLTDCDKEPIHIPGSVQPHGVLFELSEPDLVIVAASDNAGAVLGLPDRDPLGRRFSDVLAPRGRDEFAGLLSGDLSRRGPFAVSPVGSPIVFDASAHRSDGRLILELENPRPAGAYAAVDYSHTLQSAMASLQATPSLRAFFAEAAVEARALTGFDRVTVYRFDAEWNGEVVGESRDEGLSPLFGLHFPASDIPEQARRLYRLNPIRLIPDVDYRPSPILALAGSKSPPIDLSFAILRSVSPVHIRYLKNMGATASMSISILRDGRLWGLMSCMHYSGPRYVPPAGRAAFVFLGSLVAVHLGVKEENEGRAYRAGLRTVRERFLQRMAKEPDLFAGLLGGGDELLALTAARGAAVVHGADCELLGAAPPKEAVRDLVAWLRAGPGDGLFHTDSLPRLRPESEALKDVACGLLAVNTSKAEGHWVLWFRPEVVQTVDWGGDPTKPVNQAGPDGSLNPRTSFELWKQVVRLKSLPWEPAEIEAAGLLRDAIVAVVVRRAEELARLNEELRRSNTDLDAFAFSASHDLKEPLRGISNYSTFLLEDYRDRLDADGVAKLDTLVRLTRRMESLIDSLLRYSQLGREALSAAPVDLNEVLASTLEGLRDRLAERNVEVRVPRPLPVVSCDRVQVRELLTNLIANAAKYNDNPDRWVEVGYASVGAGVGAEDAPTRFYVRDNGIGIPEKHHDLIFRLFKRLHGRDLYGGGTGAGLAIARKVVERHGGCVWVESTPGAGSTFWFTLRP